MKQDFPPAKPSVRAISLAIGICLSILLPSSACVTLIRPASSAASAVIEPASLPAESANAPQININSASTGELEKLPGIGKVIAERIVEHRTRNGSFRRPEHLMLVGGISERKFRDVRALIKTE